MIKAIIFDFDGLIIDTETPWYEAFSRVYEEYGVTLSLDQWAKCIGTTFEHFNPFEYLETLLGFKVDHTAITENSKKYYNELMEKQDLRPGVLQYIERAKSLGLKTAIASSSKRNWIEPYLLKYEIKDYFDVVISSDLVMKVKPDPELYNKALEYHGLHGNEAIAFEDSLNGLMAAKKADLHCIIVPNTVTSQLPFENYDYKLQSMTQKSLDDIIKIVG